MKSKEYEIRERAEKELRDALRGARHHSGLRHYRLLDRIRFDPVPGSIRVVNPLTDFPSAVKISMSDGRKTHTFYYDPLGRSHRNLQSLIAWANAYRAREREAEEEEKRILAAPLADASFDPLCKVWTVTLRAQASQYPSLSYACADEAEARAKAAAINAILMNKE